MSAPFKGPERPFEHPDAKRRFRLINTAGELQRVLDYPWEKWTGRFPKLWWREYQGTRVFRGTKRSYLPFDKQRELAVRIASQANLAEKEALSRWIEHLLEIKASDLPAPQKAKQVISLTARSSVVLPAAKIIARETKRLGWDDRSLMGRGNAAVRLALFGVPGAGVATLGIAVGVPLWVVFGAGASFLGVLYEEIMARS